MSTITTRLNLANEIYTNAISGTARPQHQLHNSSQPLPGPGSRAAVQTQDYSPANIEH
ncbi:hypothetical protein BDR07DRAFT_1415320 [Suillus spraguei]|nr:hypothetical protein BDR07DRAFT_1415320 [Suillus spraguei]